MHYATNITIGLVLCWTIAFFLLNLFDCGTHFADNWGSIENVITQCIDESKMNKAWAGSDFGIDLVIFLMPIPAVCTRNSFKSCH